MNLKSKVEKSNSNNDARKMAHGGVEVSVCMCHALYCYLHII